MPPVSALYRRQVKCVSCGIARKRCVFSKSSIGLLLTVFSFLFSVQCMWSFFQCKEDSATCTRKHDDCVQGNDCKYNFRKNLSSFYSFLCSEQYLVCYEGKTNNNKNIEKLEAFCLPDILENRNSTIKPRSLFKNT